METSRCNQNEDNGANLGISVSEKNLLSMKSASKECDQPQKARSAKVATHVKGGLCPSGNKSPESLQNELPCSSKQSCEESVSDKAEVITKGLDGSSEGGQKNFDKDPSSAYPGKPLDEENVRSVDVDSLDTKDASRISDESKLEGESSLENIDVCAKDLHPILEKGECDRDSLNGSGVIAREFVPNDKITLDDAGKDADILSMEDKDGECERLETPKHKPTTSSEGKNSSRKHRKMKVFKAQKKPAVVQNKGNIKEIKCSEGNVDDSCNRADKEQSADDWFNEWDDTGNCISDEAKCEVCPKFHVYITLGSLFLVFPYF